MYKKAEASFWTAEEVTYACGTPMAWRFLHAQCLNKTTGFFYKHLQYLRYEWFIPGRSVEGPAALGVAEGRGEVLCFPRPGLLRGKRRYSQ